VCISFAVKDKIWRGGYGTGENGDKQKKGVKENVGGGGKKGHASTSHAIGIIVADWQFF